MIELNVVLADPYYTILEFRKKMKFFCPFENIKNYPFGKEKCSLHFYIWGIANRLTEFDCRMVYPEYQSVGQYVVSFWTIASSVRDGEKIISVTMTLDRSFSSIFAWGLEKGQ